MTTPICLDESIVSARAAADALELGACSIINVKAGRVGGYLEARRIHDVCVAHGVPVWCGGMLETGLGRAANLAFAALPGCTLPGDVSASDRYYTRDVTEPFRLVDGLMTVPSGPGLGVAPLMDILDELTESSQSASGLESADGQLVDAADAGVDAGDVGAVDVDRDRRLVAPELRTRWMSPGGAKPLTSPARLSFVPTVSRWSPSWTYSSSCSTPWRTPKTHQVTWSWIGVTWPGSQTRPTIGEGAVGRDVQGVALVA